MPGILPMKVIKVGSTTQSRVAQACDRCRSKKIRCDGTTPCCSQCANVGFECKTSDKLSRRAFPRGYTESLEERVRSLESEVRELKDLLDTKDEKIDMLSRIRSHSPFQKRASSNSSNVGSASSQSSPLDNRLPKVEVAAGLQHFTNTQDESLSIQCSAAASSGKSFVDSFRSDLKAHYPQAPNFKAQTFFNTRGDDVHTSHSVNSTSAIPSRMASDQLMNIFLQEWLPLFPILHRPNVLKLYSRFVADPDCVQSHHEIAQLYLIFGISAFSAEWNDHDPQLFENKWKVALDLAVKQVSVSSLQCLLLAMLYCIAKQDFEKLRKYKAMSAKLSRRLGLHQSQKRSSLGPLTTETRKRLFWTLFALDCFSSAILGQSRALCDVDIACEMPQDVDDEYITDDSFLTAPPGESTRVSSALAMCRGARVMADILDTVYPPAPSHEISVQEIGSLSEQLDLWYTGLAPHLCLKFMQEKPCTAIIGSRAPFLSLMYHYIRTLLYRPLFLADNSRQASTALVILAQSSKHVVQIIQLLEERRLSFSFCVNKCHVLIMAGFGLLYSNLRSNRGSKLSQDSQRYLRIVCSILDRENIPDHQEFQNIVSAVIRSPNASSQNGGTTPRPFGIPDERQISQVYKGDLNVLQRQQSFHPSHTRSSSAKVARVKLEPQDETFPMRPSFSDSHLSVNTSLLAHNAPNTFVPRHFANSNRPYSFPVSSNQNSGDQFSLPNLDYLDFGSEPSSAHEQHDAIKTIDLSNGSLSPQHVEEVFSPNAFSYMSAPASSDSFAWSPDIWNTSLAPERMHPSSALSLSEESLTSGEDLSSCSSFLAQDFLTVAR